MKQSNLFGCALPLLRIRLGEIGSLILDIHCLRRHESVCDVEVRIPESIPILSTSRSLRRRNEHDG